MNPVTVREALAAATIRLRGGGVAAPRLDAEVLLAFVLDAARTNLYINIDKTISGPDHARYSSCVQRRLTGEPVAYITGEKEFMSLTFCVDSNVLIPRPETEVLVEEALEIKPLRVVDVGTGSGAIAVSLAYYLPESLVTATDLSSAALRIAALNAANNSVSNRINFLHGDLLGPLDHPEFFGTFDLVAANLPYIPSVEMTGLPVDVRDFEPSSALDGGFDGLMYYRSLGPSAYRLLKSKGVLLVEIGYDQSAVMKDFLSGLGYANITVIKDLAGLERIVKATKP
ncbi:MAG: peptide chain release factor N(5)-glutamine methyltransferase [Thermincola sp.]|jgi:release factor glutamine methyltransferase|nr:peptide chain release factor N(5)-glutamine methyltransferase [Thermincola sp.]MDT3703507.1 peptide chain release factor N(5)-glutamine methyltransferase [Thermincola sp.]